MKIFDLKIKPKKAMVAIASSFAITGHEAEEVLQKYDTIKPINIQS